MKYNVAITNYILRLPEMTKAVIILILSAFLLILVFMLILLNDKNRKLALRSEYSFQEISRYRVEDSLLFQKVDRDEVLKCFVIKNSESNIQNTISKPTLLLLFSNQSCNVCTRKSVDICETLKKSSDNYNMLAVGAGFQREKVAEFVKYSGINMTCFYDENWNLYTNLRISKGEVTLLLMDTDWKIKDALLFDHNSEDLTFHETLFMSKIMLKN